MLASRVCTSPPTQHPLPPTPHAQTPGRQRTLRHGVRGESVSQDSMRLLKPSLCSILIPKLLAVGFKPPAPTSTSPASLPWVTGTGSTARWIVDVSAFFASWDVALWLQLRPLPSHWGTSDLRRARRIVLIILALGRSCTIMCWRSCNLRQLLSYPTSCWALCVLTAVP